LRQENVTNKVGHLREGGVAAPQHAPKTLGNVNALRGEVAPSPMPRRSTREPVAAAAFRAAVGNGGG
jgi:hypothetical protein